MTYKFIRNRPGRNREDVLDNFHTLETLRGRFVIKTPEHYRIFPDPAKYVEYFEKTPEPDRQFHEVIFNLPQKLRFDLDASAADVAAWTDPNPDLAEQILRELGMLPPADDVACKFNAVIAGILNAVYDTFYLLYNRELPAANIITCTSSGGEKFSAHIIVDGYYVASAAQAREFCQQMLQMLPREYHKFVDSGVYKETQNFRLVGCTKGDGRYKRVVTGQPPYRTFISDISDCEPLRDIIGEAAPKVAEPAAPNEDVEEALKLAAADSEFASHRFSHVHGRRVYFSRLAGSYCGFCAREHSRDNTLCISLSYSGAIVTAYKFCRKAVGVPGVEIGQFTAADPVMVDPESANSNRETRITSAISYVAGAPRPRTLFDSLPAGQKNVYSAETLRDFELVPTLVVHAPMKMGKTKALRAHVDAHFSSPTSPPVVRILSFRQTFSGSIKEKFPEFTLYSDVKGPIDHPRVIVQVESLHRLAILPGSTPPDLLIMDECESIFEQFNSGLLRGNFNECFAKFQYLLRYTKHVICMDAMITDRTYRILRQMRPDSAAFYHRNEYQNSADDKYWICGNKAKWLSYLYKSVEDDLRVSVPISSLVEAKALQRDLSRRFPAKTVKIYSSETTISEKREHFSDVNTYWRMCDVLIYTPTVSAGVSFEEKHFDRIFGFFTDQSCPAETCIQMIGRVRDVSAHEYYVCVQMSGERLPDTEESVKKLLYDRRTNLLSQFEIGGLQLSYTPTGHVQYHGDYFQVWTENTIVKNKSVNNFCRRFLQYIADFGASIEFLSDAHYETEFGQPLTEDGQLNEAATALIGDIKTAKSSISVEECCRIAAARDLDPDEVEQIRVDIGAQRDIPQDAQDAYERFRMRADYQYNGPIDAKFVAAYRPRGVRRAFRNLGRVIGRDSEAAWRAIMAQEQALHEYKFADNDEQIQSDINRNYTADMHRYALSFLKLCGWARIDSVEMRHRERILAELDEKSYWDAIDAACAVFKIRPPRYARAAAVKNDPAAYFDMLIGPVNKMLYTMYGLKLAAMRGPDIIGITRISMFAMTEADSERVGIPWLRPQ